METEKQIAVAISTRNRREVFQKCYGAWKRFYPNIEIIVVEDNDSKPRGIAATKNKCLEELLKSECNHLFLADDDIAPLDSFGLLRYVNSEYKHLCLSFDKNHNGYRISHDVFIIKNENGHNYFNSPCGVLLYIDRDVLESGITYDENYGIWGMEHKSYSLDIYKAGFVPHPFIDIEESLNHFYCMDYYQEIESSVPENIRIQHSIKNQIYFKKRHNLK